MFATAPAGAQGAIAESPVPTSSDSASVEERHEHVVGIPAAERFIPQTIGDPSRAAEFPWQLTRGLGAVPADTVLDGGESDTVVARAASCRGARHRVDGELRQDSIALALDDTGRWLAAAVADGVGSSRRSHLGARFAAEAAVRLLIEAASDSRQFDPLALANAIAGTMRVKSRDVCQGVEVRDDEIASTLCAALVDASPSASGAGLPARLFRIGDSTAAQLSAGEWAFRFSGEGNRVEDGAYFNPSTASLPKDVDGVELDDCVIGPDSPLFLMSDGVSVPLEGAGQVRSYLAECWARPPYPLEFLGQMELRRRTFDDDRSVIGIWNKST